MNAHYPVNPLAVHGRAALGDGVAAQDSPDARVAVGRHIGNDGLDPLQQFPIRQRRAALSRWPNTTDSGVVLTLWAPA
jgi:hypothetical protein